MRKPAKPAKPRRTQKPPSDQLALKTECGHCHRLFPNPTLAAWHVEECDARAERAAA